ncbi:MAG: nucleotidyltransferase domain-containing protein [Nitrospiraceae bacterium]
MREVPAEVREVLREYLPQVTKIFGATLEAVILYGSAAGGEYLPGRSNINLLMLLSRHEGTGLQHYATLHQRWQKERIVVPIFLTPVELQSSLAHFPLEFLEIQEQHLLLVGRDPFPGLTIDLRNLCLQCEQEMRGNLLRLRQRFVEGGGMTEANGILLPLSLTALLPCLRGLLRLAGRPAERSADAVLKAAQNDLGIDTTPFQEVLTLKRGMISPGPMEMPRLFERYVAALQALIDKTSQRSGEA